MRRCLQALVLLWPLALPVLAQVQTQPPVPLQCQRNGGAWQPCQMVLEADGLHWRIDMAEDLFEFRHDGRGSLSMRQGDQPWRLVEAHWRTDASLCWNGICAKGPIPLD